MNACLLFPGGGVSPSFGLSRFSSVCMSFDYIPRPGGPWDGRCVALTLSVSLYRFVWAVQHGDGVGSMPRADCSRAGLGVWIRKLDVSTSRAEDDSTPPKANESMLDWLVTFVRFGWTPREVLVCFFPDFRGSIVPNGL
jgi:hypothetical protein